MAKKASPHLLKNPLYTSWISRIASSLLLFPCRVSPSCSSACSFVACQDEFRSNFRCRRRRRRRDGDDSFCTRREVRPLFYESLLCHKIEFSTNPYVLVMQREDSSMIFFFQRPLILFHAPSRLLRFLLHQLFDRRSLESSCAKTSETKRGENERKAVRAEIFASVFSSLSLRANLAALLMFQSSPLIQACTPA